MAAGRAGAFGFLGYTRIMSDRLEATHSEFGRVLRLEGPLAVVEVSKSSACEGCAARGVCHSLGGSDARELRAVNHIGAAPGDQVELELLTRHGLRAALWAYGLPTLLFVVAAFGAHQAAGAWLPGADPDVVAALAALGAVGLFALGAWRLGRVRPRDLSRYPTVVRRL